jgi:hypothetical protein
MLFIAWEFLQLLQLTIVGLAPGSSFTYNGIDLHIYKHT